jgi:hypothetical protein
MNPPAPPLKRACASEFPNTGLAKHRFADLRKLGRQWSLNPQTALRFASISPGPNDSTSDITHRRTVCVPRSRSASGGPITPGRSTYNSNEFPQNRKGRKHRTLTKYGRNPEGDAAGMLPTWNRLATCPDGKTEWTRHARHLQF